MEILTIPEEVSRGILCSKKPFGQIDFGGKKYVFCPNNNEGGFNPVHVFDLGRKIGALVAEGKISLLGKVYFSGGIISLKGGVTSISVYQIAERWKEEKKP